MPVISLGLIRIIRLMIVGAAGLHATMRCPMLCHA